MNLDKSNSIEEHLSQAIERPQLKEEHVVKSTSIELSLQERLESLYSILIGADNIGDIIHQIFQISIDCNSPASDEIFCSTFPFDVFLEIATLTTDEDILSETIQCISHACDSKNIPLDLFVQEDVLIFFISKLITSTQGNYHQNSYLSKAIVYILTRIITFSDLARDFVISSNILTIFPTDPLEFKYCQAEFLDALCLCNNKPLPAEFIEPIQQIICVAMDGVDTGIIEFSLTAALNICKHCPNIDAQIFEQYLPPKILSDIPQISTLALELVLYMDSPSTLLIPLIIDLFKCSNNTKTIILICKVLITFSSIWQAELVPVVFELFYERLNQFKHDARVYVIGAILSYLDSNHLADTSFFNLVLEYIDEDTICQQILDYLLQEIIYQTNVGKQDEVLSGINTLMESLIEKSNSDNPRIAHLATQILDIIENNQ